MPDEEAGEDLFWPISSGDQKPDAGKVCNLESERDEMSFRDRETPFRELARLAPVGMFLTPHTESAFPRVVLKYSRSERRYVVASNQFEKYLLRGIDSLKEIVSKCERNSTYDNGSSSEERCFPSILWVVLDYVYAGRRDLGWDFFNNHYRASDKEVIRSKIEGVLRGSPVYRMTYAN